MKKCKHCKKEFVFDKPQQFGAHITNCLSNPKRQKIIEKCKNSQKGKPKNKKTCDKCGNKISTSNFDRHHIKCNQNSIPKLKIQEEWECDNGKYKCPHCERLFSKKGICTHIFLQHTTEGIEHKKQKFSNKEIKKKMGWSRGLTKETDIRVKKAAEQQKKLYSSGVIKPSFLGRKLTPEHKEKLSIAQHKLIEHGKGSNNFKHVKHYKKTNIYGDEFSLRGTYELRMANWLNDKNILWIRNKVIKYIKDDVNKNYSPDFYLPEYNLYLETKGYYPNEDRIKMKLVLEQNNINLKMIFKDIINNLDNISTINEILDK